MTGVLGVQSMMVACLYSLCISTSDTSANAKL
jgi:hypothetical protein